MSVPALDCQGLHSWPVETQVAKLETLPLCQLATVIPASGLALSSLSTLPPHLLAAAFPRPERVQTEQTATMAPTAGSGVAFDEAWAERLVAPYDATVQSLMQ